MFETSKTRQNRYTEIMGLLLDMSTEMLAATSIKLRHRSFSSVCRYSSILFVTSSSIYGSVVTILNTYIFSHIKEWTFAFLKVDVSNTIRRSHKDILSVYHTHYHFDDSNTIRWYQVWETPRILLKLYYNFSGDNRKWPVSNFDTCHRDRYLRISR